MGQRHQAFVVARLVPHGETKAYYRCIAALHHQWCYGRLPLRAARRLLTLVKQKDNAEIISEEIRLLQGKYGRCKRQPKMPEVPSPYIGFLLASAWNFDFGGETPLGVYASGGSLDNTLLFADMGSFEGDNNDGITVIDVTNPEQPAYCFVSGARAGPLSAADYARLYYPIPKPEEMNDEDVRLIEEDVLDVISWLDGEPLVTLEMLAEAWPREYEGPPVGKEDHPIKEDENTGTSIPALSELSLKPVLDRALERDETQELEDLVWMPGKAVAIVADFKTRESLPNSALSLLAKALGHIVDDTLDLSHLTLSTEQIVTLLTYFEGVEVLKLSHNPLVTAETIRSVLLALPDLRRLVVLGISIPHKDLSNLLANKELFFCLDALVISEFCGRNSETYPNAFSFFGIGDPYQGVAIASLPYFTPALVVQALTDYLSGFLSDDPFSPSAIVSAQLAPKVVFSTEPRKPGQRWTERSVPVIAQDSPRACQGEGWIFALKWPAYTFTEEKFYGFIQVNPNAEHPGRVAQDDTVAGTDAETAAGCKLCDLNGFLAEMESEGRPSPPAAAVTVLEGILDKLTKNGLKLMTSKEAEWFARKTK